MSKKILDLSPERAAVQNRVQDLHAIYARIGAYKEIKAVVFHWTEEFSWLPKFIRPLLRQRRSLQGPHPVKTLERDESGKPLILMVSDDREDGDPIGAIALYSEKTKEYTAFDFERGSSEDLYTVKQAVHSALKEAQTWKDIPEILSTTEWSERMKAKKPQNGHDTPH